MHAGLKVGSTKKDNTPPAATSKFKVCRGACQIRNSGIYFATESPLSLGIVIKPRTHIELHLSRWGRCDDILMFHSNFHGQRDTFSLAWYNLALAVCVDILLSPSQNLEVHCGCDMTAAVWIYIPVNQDGSDTQFLATDQERMKEQNTAYRPYHNTSNLNIIKLPTKITPSNSTKSKLPCHPHKMALWNEVGGI